MHRLRPAALLLTLTGCMVQPAPLPSPPPSAAPGSQTPPTAYVPEPQRSSIAAPGPIITAGARPALHAPTPSGCAVAELVLLAVPSGKPVVLVSVNGRMLRMAVDTGAETSVLTTQGAAWLNLAPGPARREVRGLGGAGSYGMAHVDRIALGGRVTRDLDLPIIQIGGAAGSAGGPPEIAGLIGADLLAPFQAVLDFAQQTLTLRQGVDCGAPPGSWTLLDWRATAHDLPFVGATLDGTPLVALLDTGSAYSAVRQDRVQVSAGGPAVTGFGIGKRALRGTMHRFGSLALGNVTVAQPVLRVVPLDPSLPIDMLVGMDVLANQRLWLDYAGRRAFIAPGSL